MSRTVGAAGCCWELPCVYRGHRQYKNSLLANHKASRNDCFPITRDQLMLRRPLGRRNRERLFAWAVYVWSSSLSGRFQFRRRSYQPANPVSEPGKIPAVPGEENICPILYSTMSNQSVIDCTTYDRRCCFFNRGDILVLREFYQRHAITDLAKDIDPIPSSDAWSHR